MRVLVTGANGQLGYDVIRILKENKTDYLATDIDDMDITNKEQVDKIVDAYKPNIIVHCAAYTQVDNAEDNRELCYAINVLGTRNIAQAAKRVEAKMVYISTDYVFNGEKEEPYETTDKPDPINYYGQTKYEGELEVQNILRNYFIVRISWVFGSNGNNFVKTMLKLSETKEEISVVADQRGSPTYTYDLAEALHQLIQSEDYGTHHITNEGYCTWYEFAKAIFRLAGKDVKVNPITTKEFPTKAKRPRNSRMEKNRYRLPAWQEALGRLLSENV